MTMPTHPRNATGPRIGDASTPPTSDIAYPWVAGPRDATMAGEIGPWEL